MVVDEIVAAGGEAVANGESVATVEGAASLTEQAMDQWGRLDAVVANAALMRYPPFDALTIPTLHDCIALHPRGVMMFLPPPFTLMSHSGGARLVAVLFSPV